MRLVSIAAILSIITLSLQAQQGATVTGTVIDQTGASLPGASVLQKGTTNGTVTDIDGKFSITVPNGEAVLEVSFVGYATQDIVVGTQTNIVVTMKETATALDEVVVVAYGETSRRRVNGAVSQVKSDMLENRPVANAMQALQGTSPGLVIQQRNGDPNDRQTNINIRGIGTMNSNEPLYVIDGLVSDGAAFNRLNPMDIENISVLKDAGSAAIYGSRSSNGVLLITTKKGKRGERMKVQLNAMAGYEQPHFFWTKVPGWQNAQLRNIAEVNSGNAPKFTSAQIQDLYDHGDCEPFEDQVYKNALQQNYNLSVQGGGEHTSYMVSAGYYDQESNYRGSYGVKRINFRSNLTAEYERIKLQAIVAYSRADEKSSVANIGFLPRDIVRTPTYYYYNMIDPATGKYLTNDVQSQGNFLGDLDKGGWNKYDNDLFNVNTSVEVKIIEGLKLKGQLGTDIWRDHRYTRRFQWETYNYKNLNGPATIQNAEYPVNDWNKQALRTNMQLLLDYKKDFGKHHVAALFGASNESWKEAAQAINIKMPDPDLGVPVSSSTIAIGDQDVTPETTVKTSLTSMFGRASYDYDTRYFFDFVIRYDGSSKFEEQYRWGVFPSVSLGWQLSDEAFMDFYKEAVGSLKLRASYGTVGNQNVGNYQYLTTYTLYGNTYSYNNKAVSGTGFQVGSDHLQWEQSTTLNFGFDAGFFDDKLNVQFDIFNKNTDHILVPPQFPDLYGTTPQNYNAGKMRTQGWELNVAYNFQTADVNHNVAFNLADTWNKVTYYEGFQNIRNNDNVDFITREGLPFWSYFGYKTDGFFQSQAEIDRWPTMAGKTYNMGDAKFVDRNGDGVVSADDRYYLGNAFPRFTYGFNYTAAWRGLDFSIFMQGTLKRDMMLRGEIIEPFHAGGGYGYTILEHELDYWTPTNTDARWPRLSLNNYTFQESNDLRLFNAAYLRCKNIALGYTLPQKWTSKIGMQKFRVYVNAQNLFTISGVSFIDPELSEFDSNMGGTGGPNANSGGAYPTLTYFGVGLDVTF